MNSRKRKTRTVLLLILCSYLCSIGAMTIYSQTGYIANLPAVRLTRPTKQEIPYELHAQATVEDGQLVCHVPFGSGVPGEVILPGQQAAVSKDGKESGKAVVDRQEGTVYERTGVTFYLEMTEGSLQEGEIVNIVIMGETKSYPGALARSALHTNGRGETYVYTVESQEGPWGTRYVLKEETVGAVWPPNNDSEYVLPSVNLGKTPVALFMDCERPYSGMEVRLID